MVMKGLARTVSIALLAIGFAAGAAGVTNDTESQRQIGPKVGKPLQEAHAAMTADKWDEAMNLLDQARAVPNKTEFETYQIDELYAFVQWRKNDYPGAAATFERGLNSPFFPPEKIEERLRVLLKLNYDSKNYPKAVEVGTRLLNTVKQPDPELRAVVGRAQYVAEDFKGAIATMDRAIQDARASGKPVDENWLQVQLSSYVKLQDGAGVLAVLERLAVEFPKREHWDNLFAMLKRQSDMDLRVQLNLYRLMFDTGLMKEADDYAQAARAALRLGVPGEALTLLEQGKAKSVFTGEVDEERGRQMLQEARLSAQQDRKTLAGLEQEARAAKNGEADVQLGIAFMSYAQYDKAVEALQRGLKKGGLKHGSEADLMLGRSLLKLDRKPEAKAAFERAAAAAGARQDDLSHGLGMIAKLWLTYVQQPSVVST